MRRRLATRLEESFTLRRLARRAGRGPAPVRVEPLERPVGAKLEITYACNLRCDFCYTDSPRRTLQRSIDMDDDAWRAAVEQVLDLGVIEVVVTGGEPLLRAPLTLELLDRLDEGGVAVSLNTNGWFVDEAVADRLARLEHLTVHISIDGPTPEVHDAARGVPGSFRRAVRAIDLLVARGVTVTVNHVVTPLNEHGLEEVLDVAWRLGVGLVRVTPVVPIGAASRVDGWSVDRAGLRRLVEGVQQRTEDDFEVILQSGTADQVAYHDERAPGAFLVRPDGAVRIDSINPFAFGRVEEGLAECWKRITEEWSNREVSGWAHSIGSSRELGSADVVAYADDEVRADAPVPARRGPRAMPRLPKRSSRSTEPADLGDVEGARREVTAMVLDRRYRVAPLRWAGHTEGERVVRVVHSGRVCKLSASAALLLDHLDGASAAEAAGELAARHPRVDRARIERDTIQTVRWLLDRRVIEPAGALTAAGLAAGT
jgi:MoaA/NifB/PqqE/SkfB family radical SAM enzyme